MIRCRHQSATAGPSSAFKALSQYLHHTTDTYMLVARSGVYRIQRRVLFALAAGAMLAGSISASANRISCDSISVGVPLIRKWHTYYSGEQTLTLIADQTITPAATAAITIRLTRDRPHAERCDDVISSNVAGIITAMCHRTNWQRDM